MPSKICFVLIVAIFTTIFSVISIVPVESAKQLVKSKQTIKVTFIELGALGCIPCKMMQPIMKEVEEKYKDQIRVVFYDVRTPEGRPYADKYRIRMIPTQVFLDKDGNEYYRHVGFFPRDELEKILYIKGVK